ncbi:MAG: TolC family protein, partial [Flavobacteriaceae bacterium]|nr:TolC family protein [Flavobacteriaceae bacterium]
DNPVMAFSAKLNQGVFTQEDFDIAKLNHPDNIENFTTSIEIKQPIFNPEMFSLRKAAKNEVQATDFQNQFKKEALLLEAEQKYMQLQLAYKQLESLKKSFLSAEALKRQTKDLFDQGLVTQAEVLQVEVRVNEVENQMNLAQNEIENTSDYLHFLMNSETRLLLIPADSLRLQFSKNTTDVSLPEDRADLIALDKMEQAYASAFKAQQWNYLPQLNAFANLQYFDDQALQSGNNSYFVGAEINWQIFSGNRRLGKLRQAKAQWESAQVNKEKYRYESSIQLQQTQRLIQSLERELNLKQSSLDYSLEALRIIKNRHKEGLEKTAEVLQAEAQAAMAEFEYNHSLFKYNQSLAQLNFLLNTKN